MNIITVQKSSLRGLIRIPASKSHTLRALIFALMAEGKSIIYSYLESADTQSMIKAIEAFGAKVQLFPDRLEVEGVGGHIQINSPVDAGNSGIILRFMTALSTMATSACVITGDHSIRHQRSMSPLLKALRKLGASIVSMRGEEKAPLIIKGPLVGSITKVLGEDSQFVSALLIACAFKNSATEIEVENAGELPWVGLTLDWFDKLGITYRNDNFEKFYLEGGSHYKAFEYTVPGDFSSAAFPLASALVTRSSLTLENLNMQDIQGDKELIYVLEKMGAKIEINSAENNVKISGDAPLNGIDININNFIDSVTILATLACFATSPTVIRGASIARGKECNRLKAIAEELNKMGGKVSETADGLQIDPAPLKGGSVFSHNDHRMCMSLAIAGMGAEGVTQIEHSDCVSKTFPSFVQDFKRLGAFIDG